MVLLNRFHLLLMLLLQLFFINLNFLVEIFLHLLKYFLDTFDVVLLRGNLDLQFLNLFIFLNDHFSDLFFLLFS